MLGPPRWTSALVLPALAAGGATTAVRRFRARLLTTRTVPPPPGPARAWLSPFGLTLLNPTTVVYFTALVLGTGTGTADAVRPSEQGVFVPAALAASASRQLLLAGSGALLGRAPTGHRGRLLTALGSSAVMTVPALRMVV